MKRLRFYYTQTKRGCGWLPYVGEHPGTFTVLFLVFITGVAASRGDSFVGFVVGLAVGLLVYGPMYLYGAYARAKVSDLLSRSKEMGEA